jgi:SWI/SNF-related matrix-associated actin-dependent regulator of chromatin subfamily A3
MCRTDLSSPEKTLVSPAEEKPAEEEDENSLENMSESSSKLDALLHILDGIHPYFSMVMIATRTKDPSVKTIVFSQFTKFLDVIQCHLERRGFTFVRLDGSMSLRKRDDALDTFSTSPKHTIMLASLGVCSVGVDQLLIRTYGS